MAGRRVVIPMLLVVSAIVTVSGCGTTRSGDEAVSDSPTSTTPIATTTSTTTVSTTTTVAVTSAPSTLSPAAVLDFPIADDLDGWSVVNDTVMGGVSSGELAWTDGAMVFTGELSLDNNGGFASVRSPFLDPASVAGWGEREALSVEVRGDGRSWAVEVRTFSDIGGWLATVTPPVDDVAVIEVPWVAFAPVTRFLDARDAPAPLDPTDIASVAFYLIDGIEAPFRLEVRSIS